MLRILPLLLILIIACHMPNDQSADVHSDPPEWAKDVIWYQIFVERFHNGDPTNDPDFEQVQEAAWFQVPSDWQITPWTHNWYEMEDWAKSSERDFYSTVQLRRYGGDLQGVMDKIPYLKELGITAVYFNPLNDAPSLHKYDARNYHHIDIHFGPDPEGDKKLIAQEDPSKPETWVWTSADKLFLQVIEALHENDIKVVLDFSWNHTGRSFWAFKDILKNGSKSPFANWYEGAFQKDEETDEDVFIYDGWYGIKSLPEWKKIESEGKIAGKPYEGNLYPDVKQHIFDVTKRWMDPYGTGETHKGLDGIRLDVAEHVPVGFWREYRTFVKNINPEFYLVGENWWEDWPHTLMDAAPWLQGDIFDAVMHYQWYKIARAYFAGTEERVNAASFVDKIDSLHAKYKQPFLFAMMNLSSSHDTPRLLTSFHNKGLYKHMCKPSENPNYFTGKPDIETYQRVKLFLLHQFTFPGAPHIWNGDEMGIWGADDPDNRKPLWWHEYSFDPETAHPTSNFQYTTEISKNEDLLSFYKTLTRLRKSDPIWSRGNLSFIHTDMPVVIYKRHLDDREYLVVFNMENQTHSIPIEHAYKVLLSINHSELPITEDQLELPSLSGIVLEIKT